MIRRNFIRHLSLTEAGLLSSISSLPTTRQRTEKPRRENSKSQPIRPLVLATWTVEDAVRAAHQHLIEGRSALDAVEHGCKVEEANEAGQSVGKGGLPDREGMVSLDACIMDHRGNCGSVVYLQNVVHAVSVARHVMESTPHVMLAGDGAEKFALERGFKKEELLTEQSRKAWEKWKLKSEYQPIINIEQHDTIGMLAIDKNGNISGACSTSGVAYKMAGRVGDSPIIGSGLYVDNEIGACTATGLGEEVVKSVASFLVVELMRQGFSPQQACEAAIHRILKKAGKRHKKFQVALLAVDKNGLHGAYSIQPGFTVTRGAHKKVMTLKSDSFIRKN